MKRRAKKSQLRAYAIPLSFLMSVLALAVLGRLLPGGVAVSVWNTRPDVTETFQAVSATTVQQTPDVLPVELPAVSHKELTTRLQIPVIEVDADIESMGLTTGGAMAVPSNNTDVGWYDLGTRPGDIGSAVIGGHNRWNASAAVFDRLDELHIGDTVSVVSAEGVTSNFIVRELRTYAAGDSATDIFESNSGAHLNLITCSGEWISTKKDYADRLIVFTDQQE